MVGADIKSRLSELESILEGYHGKKILLVCRGPPDPDFNGSAYAFSAIAKSQGVLTAYISDDPAGHPQNRMELDLLGMEIPQFEPGESLDDFSGYAVLDARDIGTTIKSALKDIPRVALIDHHESKSNGKRQGFIDVRLDVGSTCTILSSYVLEKGIVDQTKEGVLLATALDFGIRTDTDHFKIAMPEDYRVMAHLSKFSDKEILNTLLFQTTPGEFINAFFEAWNSRHPLGRYVISGVPDLSVESRDALGYAASQIIKVPNYDTSIVFSIVYDPKKDNYSVQGSLRTCNPQVQPFAFLEKMFPDIKELKGSRGAKRHMGGFRIPLESFEKISGKTLSTKENRSEYATVTVMNRFFKALGYK